MKTSTDGETTESEVPDVAMEMLKAEEGRTIHWQAGLREAGALTILRWGDRSNVQGVEAAHNPGVCMRAAGWEVSEKEQSYTTDICDRSVEIGSWEVSRPGLKMRAYSCIIRRFREPAGYGTERTFWNSDRLKAVVAGRRDAPRLVLLVYLPLTGSPAESGEDLQAILKATLCGQEPS